MSEVELPLHLFCHSASKSAAVARHLKIVVVGHLNLEEKGGIGGRKEDITTHQDIPVAVVNVFWE